MRIKKLFAIPDGEKVTEKALRRVLISSVCSILLCMTCLVSTTWAWFTVSVENKGNVIQTADAPNYILRVDGKDFVSGEKLLGGDHIVSIEHTGQEDDLQKKCTLYVTFIVDEVTEGYIILGGEYPHSTNVTISNTESCVLSWTVSWFKPGNPDVKPLIDNKIQITAEDPSEETTGPTEESTETSSETTGPTAETTEPSTDTTAPTEATAEPPAEETTIPTTESTEAATEATTAPALTGETTIPAADETTAPASMPTNATEPVTEPDGTTAPAETE